MPNMKVFYIEKNGGEKSKVESLRSLSRLRRMTFKSILECTPFVRRCQSLLLVMMNACILSVKGVQ